MAGVSISRAWEESRGILTSDGRLMTIVATALIGLPTVISTLIAPETGEMRDSFKPQDIVVVVLSLLMLVGQLAIVRLALGPSLTVGAAIGHGARRMPVLLGALILLMLALFIPLGIVFAAMGVGLDGETPPVSGGATLVLILTMILVILVAVRMMVSAAVTSAEHVGPIGVIRRSWELTKGHFWKLFGFILAFMLAAMVVLLAIGAAVGAVVALTMGPIEPMSASALVVGLVQGVFNASLTTVLAVMTTRIYVQLSGRDLVEDAAAPAETPAA